jgi:ParB-like chromosome segregation protein Spo0J
MISFKQFLIEYDLLEQFQYGVQHLPIDKVSQSEELVRHDVVNDLRTSIRAGKDITPISVGYDKSKNKYTLFDGNHRLAAHKLEGKTHIKADVERYKP